MKRQALLAKETQLESNLAAERKKLFELNATIFDVIKSYRNSMDKLIADYPSWDKARDARITVFVKSINVLKATQLSLVYLLFNLTKKEWWKFTFNEDFSVYEMEKYKDAFSVFSKIGLLHMLFSSAIESSFRAIIRAIAPEACSNGCSAFKNIYAYLLSRLGLKKWEALLDLLRCLRNAIHNNGVYFHESGKDEFVEFKGIKYKFEIGKKIQFATWDFMLDLCREVEKMIADVIRSGAVNEVKEILDPCL